MSSPALAAPAAAYWAATRARSTSSAFASALDDTREAAIAAAFAALPFGNFAPFAPSRPAAEVGAPGADFVYPYEAPGAPASAAARASNASDWKNVTIARRTINGCFIACNK